MTPQAVVSREEWHAAQAAHLRREKELTHLRDQVLAERRALPWLRVDKHYHFESPSGPTDLAGLFDGRGQLIVYHFMLAPGWEAGCVGCSFLADHFDGTVAHLNSRDVSFAAVSRAPLAEIEAYRARMGWRFPWVSSFGSDFNHDHQATFTPEELASGQVFYNFRMTPSAEAHDELHGLSVFARDEQGAIFRTHSSYARGNEDMLTTFMLMDRTPKGRNEEGTMSWVRRHDEYEGAAPATPSCCG
jgi:predicted dithiol-disulfide oxidoreductase (DUF899 family)